VGVFEGAINAAYHASSLDEEGEAQLERIWLKLSRKYISPFSMLGTAMCLLGWRDHFTVPNYSSPIIESEIAYRI